MDKDITVKGANFTPREFDVLACLVQGLSDKRIGEVLLVSYKTVGTHLRSIMHKLNKHKRSQIIAIILNHKPTTQMLYDRYADLVRNK